jgi:methyl-accepting chemotaxis protein
MGLFGAVMTGVGPGGGTALETVAQVAQSGSMVAQGCQQIDDAVHTYRADEHMIGAKAAEQRMHRLQQAIDDVIATMQDLKDSSRRGTETINSIVETRGQTLVLAAGGRA